MTDSHDRPRLPQLTAERLASYSVLRAIQAMCVAQGDQRAFEKFAPVEAAQSRNIADCLERAPGELGFYVPLAATRALTVASVAGGGYLVPTRLAAADNFIEGLYATSVTLQAGVQHIDQLTGNVLFPRVSTTPAFKWLGSEAETIDDSAPAFGQISATPKSVGAYLPISRQLMLQTSPAADGFIEAELGRALGGAVDGALIAGSGASGEPLGIVNTTGISTQAGASLTWAGVATMVKSVAAANGLRAPRAAAWVASPDVEETLVARERASGSGFIWDRGQINSRSAFSSNSVSTATLIFGDWSSVALLQWGALELRIDPYSNFKSGIVGVRAIMDVDVIVRYPASFCVATSVS